MKQTVNNIYDNMYFYISTERDPEENNRIDEIRIILCEESLGNAFTLMDESCCHIQYPLPIEDAKAILAEQTATPNVHTLDEAVKASRDSGDYMFLDIIVADRNHHYGKTARHYTVSREFHKTAAKLRHMKHKTPQAYEDYHLKLQWVDMY